MPTIYYLNVKQGDCSIIEHVSGHVTVIDVSNARIESIREAAASAEILRKAEKGISGNFNQKGFSVNPIAYMKVRIPS